MDQELLRTPGRVRCATARAATAGAPAARTAARSKASSVSEAPGCPSRACSSTSRSPPRPRPRRGSAAHALEVAHRGRPMAGLASAGPSTPPRPRVGRRYGRSSACPSRTGPRRPRRRNASVPPSDTLQSPPSRAAPRRRRAPPRPRRRVATPYAAASRASAPPLSGSRSGSCRGRNDRSDARVKCPRQPCPSIASPSPSTPAARRPSPRRRSHDCGSAGSDRAAQHHAKPTTLRPRRDNDVRWRLTHRSRARVFALTHSNGAPPCRVIRQSPPRFCRETGRVSVAAARDNPGRPLFVRLEPSADVVGRSLDPGHSRSDLLRLGAFSSPASARAVTASTIEQDVPPRVRLEHLDLARTTHQVPAARC